MIRVPFSNVEVCLGSLFEDREIGLSGMRLNNCFAITCWVQKSARASNEIPGNSLMIQSPCDLASGECMGGVPREIKIYLHYLMNPNIFPNMCVC